MSWLQLLDAGLGRGAIEHRVRMGHLHRLHRGVYAVGHTNVSRKGRWMAAVLACGDDAVLSHRSAAAHWSLRPSSAGIVDVTVASRSGRARRAAIRLHRSSALPPAEVALHEGIAVTTVARTLLDLAGDVSVRSAERAVEQAETLRLFDLRAVQATIDRHPTRVGAGRLTAILDAYGDEDFTRSELEAMFLALCAAHAIPPPSVNARVAGLEVDFLWSDARLIAETDGRRHHATRAAFERDRARDARLMVAGFRVVRFSYRQVALEPAWVAATLRALLGSAVR